MPPKVNIRPKNRSKPTEKDPEPQRQVMLKFGAKTNFHEWKESMRTLIAMEFGDMVSIIDTGELFEPPEIEVGDYDAADDPHGFVLHELKTQISNRAKTVQKQIEQLPKCHALMWKYMSKESIEAVLRHEDYDEDEHRNNPLQLYLSIRDTHPVGGGAPDAASRRAKSRQMYKATVQGPFEGIVDYKRRFTFNYEAYIAAGNVALEPADVAMDFYSGLDGPRYAKFTVDIENGISKGEDPPQTLNEMFQRASDFKVVSSGYRPGRGAAFATRADDYRGGGRGGGGKGSGRGGAGRGKFNGNKGHGKSDKTKKNDKSTTGSRGDASDRPPVTCWNCDQEGHLSYNCPLNEEEKEEPEHGTAHATFGRFHILKTDSDDEESVPQVLEEDFNVCEDYMPEPVIDANKCDIGPVSAGRAMTTLRKMGWWEVLLDNQADISVVHPKLLTGVKQRVSYVSGLSGTVELPYEGDLRGFFRCKGSTELMASVLCMSDVEDLYSVSYNQGVSYTVHMPGRDLVFYRRDKLYVANMRDWATDAPRGQAMVTTSAENEANFSAKEVARAKEAYQLAANAGYTSEQEALGLVNDGNFTGVPITAHDVKRAFLIYGKPTAHVRGRQKAKKSKQQQTNADLKSPPGELQSMYGDVVYFERAPYVMCLTEPLGLLTVTAAASTKTRALGEAVQTHVSSIQSKGFQPTIIHLDPQKGFLNLECSIPGVEVNVTGAGDHMNKLDVHVQHVKEVYRSVRSALPWNLPKWCAKDLVSYAINRKNLRSLGQNKVSPRVKFTGRKPNYKKELGLAFGDYCECYNPAVVSNDVTQERSEPCIALYPTGNFSGSWWFLNIKSKRRVRRSNWTKMVTTDLVIDVMNQYSTSEADAEAEDETNAAADQQVPQQEPEADIDPDTPTLITDDVDVDDHTEDLQQEVEEEEPMQVVPPERRSARIAAGVRRPVQYQCYHTSVRKGLQEHGAAAYKAIVAELRQLLQEKKALVPVMRGDLSVRQLKGTIRSLMFLKTKFDGMGRFEKIKARLVANGKQQDRNLYPDTYSPTVALQSVLTCLTVAAAEGRHISAVDIGGAYLNADRDSAKGEEVIMELEPMLVSILSKMAPEIKPYIDDRGRVLVKLSKAMYGTLDAAKIWYEKLTSELKKMGFVPNAVDPCVYNKDIAGKQCTILLYVDDLLIMCANESAVSQVIQQLEEAFGGDVKSAQDKDLSYLGMHLKVERGRITVSMESYLAGVLEAYGVKGTVTTPATASLFNESNSARLLATREAKQFHTMVAKLLYLAKRARVDILLPVAFLTTRVKAPTSDDAQKLERIMKYLNGTRDQVLVLQPNGALALEGYIDASFGCHPDGKSHTGLVVTLYGCTIMCMSSKQKLVTRDSTEAELVGMSDKLICIIQCRDFLYAQGVECGVPVVHQDNTSTITMVTKGTGKYRTKYMRVRQAYVYEHHQAGDVVVTYMPTGRMLADVLTKPLQGAVFRYLTRRITGQ